MADRFIRSECRISNTYLGGYVLQYIEYWESLWPEIVENLHFDDTIDKLKQHHKIYFKHLPKINPIINELAR
jgi:hypothetical protein